MTPFFVHGIPRPEGSTRAWVRGGKAIITHANKNLLPWRQEVAACAVAAHVELSAKHIPVEISAAFVFPRPSGVSEKKRPLPSTRPDIDKLLRGILDALAGIAYVDDGQVCSVSATKTYARDGERIGAHIRVAELTK